MGKPLFKTLAVLLVANGAIAICLLGYRQNNQKQYEQRVAYAKTAISAEKDSLATIEEEIGKLYNSDDRTILQKDVSQEDVTKLVAKLASVKVSADDYGIEEDALPSDSKEIQAQKATLDDELKDAEAKIKIQTGTDALFTKGVSNWQKAENDVIIKADLKDTDVGNVRENLNFFDDSAWKDLVKEYLGYADAQLDRIAKLDESFDSMLKDDVVTSEVTLEKYLSVVESINQIRNEDLKEKYTKLADSISIQMGYSGYYSNSTSTSTYTDTYSDTTYQDESVESDTDSAY
ncbi:hypothetical protein [Enterococcus casseliflavus]|uniref:hypothetical protein n=1 Tax=Enterococcus casseliflavus TaxID=37734 RepID=UPI002954C92C|nr:hypothetical protein [Enterococcus casseliflavus]MDV7751311.1 hypothetical protein [Enterococcus casseliflavus]